MLAGVQSAPPCSRPSEVDILWIIEASGSIEDKDRAFLNMTTFVGDFAATRTLSETQTRMGFLQFTGPSQAHPGLTTIGETLNLTEPSASNLAGFVSAVGALGDLGGTTDTITAIEYVREHMFTPENKRPNVNRIVILMTDGDPTDNMGASVDDSAIEQVNQAVVALREEDDVIFVLVRLGDLVDYSDDFLLGVVDFRYDTAYDELQEFLLSDFLCFDTSEAPTSSPASAPTVTIIDGGENPIGVGGIVGIVIGVLLLLLLCCGCCLFLALATRRKRDDEEEEEKKEDASMVPANSPV